MCVFCLRGQMSESWIEIRMFLRCFASQDFVANWMDLCYQNMSVT